MNAKEFEKYKGKKTTGKKGLDVLSGGKIVGYDPKDTHHLQLLAIDDNLGDSGKMFEVKIPNKDDFKDWLDGKHKYVWVTVDNVLIDEPSGIIYEPLDLTKILEGCNGVTLWSNVLGECKLENIYVGAPYPIVVSITDKYESFTKEGLYNDRYESAECTLFPSETNRDWSTFNKPIKLNTGDFVVCWDDFGRFCVRRYKINNECYHDGNGGLTVAWRYIVPFNKFNPELSEKELKKLSVI